MKVKNIQTSLSNQILKATALIYLKDALDNQDYEECEELIQKAKKFGATQNDIDEILQAEIRFIRPGNIYEENK